MTYIVFYNGIKVKSYKTLRAARAACARKTNWLARNATEYVAGEFSIFDSSHRRHSITVEA